MRNRLAAIGFAVAVLASSAAQAGSLVHAQLTLRLGTLPPASFSASGLLGGSAQGTGATATWTVAAGAVPVGTASPTIGSSAAPPITQVQHVINGNAGAGAFAASAAGNMLLTGQINIKAYAGFTLLGVPIGFGVPTTVMPPVSSGIGVTSDGNAWTTKTTAIVLTSMLGTGSVTRMGANGLIDGAGTVVLVTALNIITSVSDQLPSFAVLTLTYAESVAEPAALLFAAVSGGLIALGRRARRR